MNAEDAEHYQRWIDQIKEYLKESDFDYNNDFVIKLALSYTLQSLRNDENLKRFQWKHKTTNNHFKDCLIEYDKSKQNLKKNKRKFKYNVIEFMRNKGIPIKVLFFGNTFGLDIAININNVGNVPRKIPLDVLTDFCNKFGCEFEYTNCDGKRYIFSFNGLDMGI